MSPRSVVCLLRGINVGGRHSLPMAELRALIESCGASAVQTYIQSGNAVFSSAAADLGALSSRIGKAIEVHSGFMPKVWLIESAEFAAVVQDNPFPQAVDAGKTLHVAFCERDPHPDATSRLEALRSETEAFALRGRVFYLHAPEGIGRSKLAASTERALGTPLTMRNWNTVARLMEMVAAPR